MSEPPPPRLADVANTTQEHFRLLDLPAELRENILITALLDVDERCLTQRFGFLPPDDPTVVRLDDYWRPPALLATSQQLRKDAGCIYFKICNFIFMDPHKAVKWVKNLVEDFRNRISTLSYCRCSAGVSPKNVMEHFAREASDVAGALKYCVRTTSHYWRHYWGTAADAAKGEDKRER